MLLRQAVRLALAWALPNAGSSNAARMAMMAMTTSNSMSVKASPNFPLEYIGRLIFI